MFLAKTTISKSQRIHALLNATIKPASYINNVQSTVKAMDRAAYSKASRIQSAIEATVDQIVTDAPASEGIEDTVLRCIRSVYKLVGNPFERSQVQQEIAQARDQIRRQNIANGTVPYLLPDDAAISDFNQRGYGRKQVITLDLPSLRALIAGQSLGDFSDQEYTHIIQLDASAKAWLNRHLD